MIQNYADINMSIQTDLYRTNKDYARLYRAIQDYIRLYSAIQGYKENVSAKNLLQMGLLTQSDYERLSPLIMQSKGVN